MLQIKEASIKVYKIQKYLEYRKRKEESKLETTTLPRSYHMYEINHK